jgi:hypothetical protein
MMKGQHDPLLHPQFDLEIHLGHVVALRYAPLAKSSLEVPGQ